MWLLWLLLQQSTGFKIVSSEAYLIFEDLFSQNYNLETDTYSNRVANFPATNVNIPVSFIATQSVPFTSMLTAHYFKNSNLNCTTPSNQFSLSF